MKQTEYTDKRFGSLTFNPVIDEPMLEAYPKLHEIVDPMWLDDEFIDQLLRYIILLYDPASPLIREESDLNHRRAIAIEVANIDNTDLIDQLNEYIHPFISELAYNYLKRFGKSKEFAILIALEFKFWEAIKMTMTPIYGDNSKQQLEGIQKKQLVASELDKDIKGIETYRKAFFGEELYEVVKKKKLYPTI
jgi:hypothetical protein